MRYPVAHGDQVLSEVRSRLAVVRSRPWLPALWGDLMRIPDKTLQAVKLTVCLALLAGAMMLLCTQGCATVGVRGNASRDADVIEATRVTMEVYQCTGKPPTVLVVDPSELTCTDPHTDKPGFEVLLPSGRDCREGYTLVPGKISVAERLPWSDSSLPHEVKHHCHTQAGILDPWHLRSDWADVSKARDVLRSQGR